MAVDTNRRTHPWRTVGAAIGALVLGPIGVMAGSVGQGIEPDGQYIPCGPVFFGRNDSQWDPRCVAANDGFHTLTVGVLAVAVLLLISAVVSAVYNRRIRRERRRHVGPSDPTDIAPTDDDRIHIEVQRGRTPLRWWRTDVEGTAAPPQDLLR